MARRMKLPELKPAPDLATITPDEMVAIMMPDGTLTRTTAGKISQALDKYRNDLSKAIKQSYDNDIKTPVVDKSTINGRDKTNEELAVDLCEQLSGRDGDVADVLNLINSKLIERLGHNAGQAREIAAIATKRFEEALQVLNNLRAGASVPSPKNY